MKNNKDLEQIAVNILKQANLYEEDKFGFPIAILMTISIILTCIRIIQECNKNKTSEYNEYDRLSFYKNNINNLSINKNWFTKMRLKKVIRQNLSKEEYKNYGNKLLDSILKYGETLTDEETSTLMEASNV